jgi:hypothetical protein
VKLTKCTTLRRRGGARRVANGIADAAGRDFLQNADPVLARLFDARPVFRPNAW